MSTRRVSSFSTGETAAILTLLLIKRHEESSTREITRLRVSRKSVRLMAHCKILREHIINDWVDAMEQYGWAVAPYHDHFFIFKIIIADKGWARLSTKPIINEIGRLGNDDGDTMLKEIEAQLPTPSTVMEDDED
jgi:hypothetical protein